MCKKDQKTFCCKNYAINLEKNDYFLRISGDKLAASPL